MKTTLNFNAYLTLVKNFPTYLFVGAISIFFTSCTEEQRKDHDPVVEQELNQVRQAVIPFRDLNKAIAEGYDQEVTGYRTQMGFHYLNTDLLDNKFEIGKPEILLYAPYGKDTMKLVAVEYATPIKDIKNPPAVPEGFTGKDDEWEINTEFNLWTLHAWVELDNTHGIFAPHNTKLP
ncbi:hypothetical protein MUK70_21250 [Dyadobacter chenwenxiniae]|uniref:Uncharacterized protein n=1 Tax=Dyadobacter chenwenxiniae TaxID=2906456 RepID=A0A9X1PJA2_9BACT|nr:hypothetical protein [Dyadobacter chenwenxiniae]MCF0061771.1 hypothetical protein [Dyadobacter chenwenxiniae]UON81588.1 hypothetical protein MUK70_21250 [Dyadobacter chenwenxiniae]